MKPNGIQALILDSQKTAAAAKSFVRDGWAPYAREKATLAAHLGRQALREPGEKTYRPCIRCLDFAAGQ